MTNNNNNISNMNNTPSKKNSKSSKNEENCSTGGPLVTYETSGEGKKIYREVFRTFSHFSFG